MRNAIVATAIVAMALTAASASAAPSTGHKCEMSKNKIAGSYYLCRAKAEATAISKAMLPDYSKCTAKFDEKWDGADWATATCASLGHTPGTLACTAERGVATRCMCGWLI